MIKLIISDLDGTLLNDDQVVTPEFYDCFEKLSQNGIRFAAASGRQYFNMKKVLAPIADRMIFVAENGGLIMKQEQELYSHELPWEEALFLIKEARKIPDTGIFVCGRNSAYIEDAAPEYIDTAETYFGAYQVVEDLTQVQDKILKVSVFCHENKVHEKCAPYLDHLQGGFKQTLGGIMWYDIIPQNSNKGVAVKQLQKILGVTPDECLVFGDYLNDLEMMASATHSYAMANAHPKVKESARHTCEDNNHNGVSNTILQYLD